MPKEINNVGTDFAFKGAKGSSIIQWVKRHTENIRLCLTGRSVKKKEAILESNFNNTEHVLLNFPVKFWSVCPSGILILSFINKDIKIDRMEHNCYLVAKSRIYLLAQYKLIHHEPCPKNASRCIIIGIDTLYCIITIISWRASYDIRPLKTMIWQCTCILLNLYRHIKDNIKVCNGFQWSRKLPSSLFAQELHSYEDGRSR